MAMTSIEARCRRCSKDFGLLEVRAERTGRCPRCGYTLTLHWTDKLIDDANSADAALHQLVRALRDIAKLPGNVALRPHTVLRNLFEEIGWEDDLARDPEMLREELRELRSLLAGWERLDPVVATRPRRTRFSERSTG